MRWDRREYIDLETHKSVKRPMFVELFGPLIGLDKEWIEQGATKEELDMTAFDWDYVETIQFGGNTGIYGGEKTRVEKETKEYIIEIDELGRRMKLMKGFATVPLPMDYPVKDMDSWLKVKPLYEFNENRIDWNKVELAISEQNRGVLVKADLLGGFDLPRNLFGEEELCYAYFEQAEVVKDMLDTVADMTLKVFERISDKIVIDQLSIHEDMAGKSGPMIGPNQINEFVKPYYLSVINYLKANGTQIISQDSDGDMNPVIDCLLESGLTEMYPMEPGSNMDIVQIRDKYKNNICLKGGINKYEIKYGKDAIRKELEYKMQKKMQTTGIIYGLDHRIPNGTPLEYYKYYVDLGRELLGIDPLNKKNKGWARQAF